MSQWFPKPAAPNDLLILGPGQELSEQTLFDLLHDPHAVEWKEKVGVATPADGSAKATTRLLKTRDWVFKTDVHQRTPDKAGLRARLQRLLVVALQVDLWHPAKCWFLLRTAQGWWPVSACPLLTTIRHAPTWETRIQWWTRMVTFGLEVSLEHGIGLDMNPSNFAFADPQSEQLYYLDDEFYAQHDCFDIAEAVVARIPEEPQAAPEKWEPWGQQLAAALQAHCQERDQWRRFIDGIREYPLPASLEAPRAALVHGLQVQARSPAVAARPKALRDPQRTCIFADVHGNLPALDSILRQARQLQVDSYLFLGDVVSYGPFPRQCIQRLAELKNLISLRGNHDHTVGTGVPENGSNRVAQTLDMWTVQQLTRDERDWLLALPVEYQDEHWLLVHGAPQDPRRFYAYVYELTYKDNLAYLAQQDLAVCFYGHTHVQFMYHRFADQREVKTAPERIELFRPHERLLINPGSVGQPRDGDPRAAFAIWERATNIVTFYRLPYPVNITTNAIKKEGLPEDLVYRLEVGR